MNHTLFKIEGGYNVNRYQVYLPENLLPAISYKISGGEEIKDEFGRRLGKPINVSFLRIKKTKLEVGRSYAVIEKDINNDIPPVTNLKNIKLKYQGLSSKKLFLIKKKIELSNPLNKQYPSLGLEDLLEEIWCYIRIDYGSLIRDRVIISFLPKHSFSNYGESWSL